MKKRKAPIGLIVALVILCGFIVYVNARARAAADNSPDAQQQQQQQQQQSQEPVKTPDAKQLGNAIASKVSSAPAPGRHGPTGPGGPRGPGGPGGESGSPMLLKPKEPDMSKPPKIDPSTQTAGQWYQKDSGLKGK